MACNFYAISFLRRFRSIRLGDFRCTCTGSLAIPKSSVTSLRLSFLVGSRDPGHSHSNRLLHLASAQGQQAQARALQGVRALRPWKRSHADAQCAHPFNEAFWLGRTTSWPTLAVFQQFGKSFSFHFRELGSHASLSLSCALYV